MKSLLENNNTLTTGNNVKQGQKEAGGQVQMGYSSKLVVESKAVIHAIQGCNPEGTLVVPGYKWENYENQK